jgi:two-component system sensor kinase FixL
MGWIDIVWISIAASCLTLTAIQTHVWLRRRGSGSDAAVAVMAASVAVMVFVELRLLGAQSIAEYVRFQWWYGLPVWSAVVALVWFVLRYLRAGRLWLGCAAIALRTIALLINLASPSGFNYLEVTEIAQVALFGDVVAVARGVPNPLMVIGQASLLLMVVFVVDAAREIWRRGDRRLAVNFGGSLVLFVIAGTAMAIGSFWGLVRLPIFASLFFLPIVLAMAAQLGADLIRSAELERDLQDSQQRLALAADAANAALWNIDVGSGRIWGTDRARAMFDLPIGTPQTVETFLARVHADDRIRLGRLFARAAETGRRVSAEFRVVHRDGSEHWFSAVGSARRDAAGRIDAYTGVSIDITARKRAESELALQRAELEHLARVAMVTELSGTLAHEINQPLAIIMSNAEAAQRELSAPRPDLLEVRAMLEDIVAADERAGEVIRRLRAMLRRGEGGARQALSPDELVGGVLDFLHADLERRGIAVETRLEAGAARIEVDRVALEQVLINLVGNACDALTGEPPGRRVVRLGTAVAGAEVCIEVADFGPGPGVEPERLFEAFFTTKPQGLGLGLPISRSIILGHGGTLSAVARPSSEGGGAVFTIRLPLAGAAADGPRPHDALLEGVS